MQCPTCTETIVTAFCRHCGKGVCPNCAVELEGTPHCRECAEELRPPGETPQSETRAEETLRPRAASRPELRAAEPAPQSPHPLLAGLLGLVPGLGAVYNGQYVKGAAHVAVLGLLMTFVTHETRTLFVPMIVFFWLYMPIEATRTARAIGRGERPGEMSGLVGDLFSASSMSAGGPVGLIAAGILLLTITLGALDMDFLRRFWPVLVILLGVYKLVGSIRARAAARRAEESAPQTELP